MKMLILLASCGSATCLCLPSCTWSCRLPAAPWKAWSWSCPPVSHARRSYCLVYSLRARKGLWLRALNVARGWRNGRVLLWLPELFCAPLPGGCATHKYRSRVLERSIKAGCFFFPLLFAFLRHIPYFRLGFPPALSPFFFSIHIQATLSSAVQQWLHQNGFIFQHLLLA